MIRYIHIGEQITEGDCAFALFDTVTNSFLSFAGSVVFLDYDDVREAWGTTPEPKPEWSRIESLIDAYMSEQLRARKEGDSLNLAYEPSALTIGGYAVESTFADPLTVPTVDDLWAAMRANNAGDYPVYVGGLSFPAKAGYPTEATITCNCGWRVTSTPTNPTEWDVFYEKYNAHVCKFDMTILAESS